MIEKVGNTEAVVRNYTSNFDIKEYVHNVILPRTFPNIPVGKLTLGLTGITGELVGNAIEDAFASASLMLNESFITKAVLPDSIYSHASLYDLGYNFAKPSVSNFALQIWLPDIIKFATAVRNTNIYRYRLDKDTRLTLGNITYRLDYDIIIDYQFIEGKRVFNVYYDMEDTNSISIVTNKYIKHQVSSSNWLVLFMDIQEFNRKVETNTISDNLITANSDIELKWTGQIAGIDLIYITPQGERLPMKLKHQYTSEDVDPFAWYQFKDDHTITLSFSANKGFFTPAFNSKIESTIYTCIGANANFDKYDREATVPVQRTGDRYEYNADTQMVAWCYSGSSGGLNRGTIEDLRDDIVLAHNTANVLTTDYDLKLYFEKYAKRYNTKAEFFKRRDDPTGRLFSQFIAIVNNTYTYPTNTLSIEVSQEDFDFVNSDANGNNQEFIIKPGHLWEYNDKDGEISRNTLRMIKGTEGMAMINDEALPPISPERPFMFVNPFYIKIFKDPSIAANYNTLLNNTSWPEDVPISTESFYQFQLATFFIERSISNKKNDTYHLEVICVPVVTTDTSIKYIEGTGEGYPVSNNNLRLILITRTASDGETGYIEMTPTRIRDGGGIVFEADLVIHDNISSDMKIEIDQELTKGIKSLIEAGPNKGKVLLDTQEASFHFITLMKDFANKYTSTLFGDPRYAGYMTTNRFANAHRDLSLYKPMNMMRSVITFSGENGNYTVNGSLMPFLRYDIPLDDEKMSYFIRAFDEQYNAMKPVLRRLDGNTSIDFKLYNTYGRSSNYYIGPKDGETSIRNSDILLDNVYVKIKLVISVYDRSLYTQTVNGVIQNIQTLFESLNAGERTDVHVSEITNTITMNQPNVRYVRFLGFNDYDANKQSIFVKYSDISELREDQLQPHVPEIIRVDANSIEIIEET